MFENSKRPTESDQNWVEGQHSAIEDPYVHSDEIDTIEEFHQNENLLYSKLEELAPGITEIIDTGNFSLDEISALAPIQKLVFYKTLHELKKESTKKLNLLNTSSNEQFIKSASEHDNVIELALERFGNTTIDKTIVDFLSNSNDYQSVEDIRPQSKTITWNIENFEIKKYEYFFNRVQQVFADFASSEYPSEEILIDGKPCSEHDLYKLVATLSNQPEVSK